ncbi:MAG: hypothetical protein ABNH00_05290 [Dokdonia sp.]|jgi:hypothetical protein|nr:hypothetical protein [Cytophagaceae bacterium]
MDQNIHYDNQNELVKPPSWWKRNWKWALPAGGCLTIITIAIVVVVGGLYSFAEGIKEDMGYEPVVEAVQQNQEVIDAIGTPITSDGVKTFNIKINNGDRSNHVTIGISGPDGEALIDLITLGKDKTLTYEKIEVYVEGTEQVISLDPMTIDQK